MNEIIQKLLSLWAKDTAKDSNENQIAKHLSKVLLFELKGIDSLYPDLKDKCELLIKEMTKIGKPIKIFECFRSAKKQNEYYNKIPKITNAKGLQSYHQFGLAFDAIFENYNWNPPNEEWWNILGQKGEELGLIWGGHFDDKPHFEWHPSIKWEQMEQFFK